MPLTRALWGHKEGRDILKPSQASIIEGDAGESKKQKDFGCDP